MLFGTISAVLIKAILWKFAGVFLHAAIATDLGDDAGSGDGEGLSIALDDALVGQGELFHGQAIDETEVDGELIFFLKRKRRSGHALMGRTENVEGIDGSGISLDLCPADIGVMDQLLEKEVTFFRGDFFRVIQTCERKFFRQNDSCHRNGTRERSAPSFIDAANDR